MKKSRIVLSKDAVFFLFPYSFMFIIEHMMPLCMTVSWIYTVALAVQAIVYEKEQRLKEVMKMMGLSNAVHWVAWFITSLCVMSITVFLLVITLKVNKLFLFLFGVAGAVASGLVPLTLDQVVWVQSMAWDVLRSWTRPYSTQVYKWVSVDLMWGGGVILPWTNISSRGE